MRTVGELESVTGLIAAGLNDCQISRLTGIPRRTVHDWRSGRTPDFSRSLVVPPGVAPDLSESIQPAYAYLLGLYLGDGHIVRTRRTYRLRITLDGIYPSIVAECRSAIERVVPNKVGVVRTASRAVVVNAYSNSWPQLFPQHGAGPKHQRAIELAPWQAAITNRHPEPLIRGLIHSDGSRTSNRIRHKEKVYTYPRYEFCNYSTDIQAIFCEHLDLLKIPWRQMNRWTISVARRDAVARLDAFVGPKE